MQNLSTFLKFSDGGHFDANGTLARLLGFQVSPQSMNNSFETAWKLSRSPALREQMPYMNYFEKFLLGHFLDSKKPQQQQQQDAVGDLVDKNRVLFDQLYKESSTP
jgi:hypothetical protein